MVDKKTQVTYEWMFDDKEWYWLDPFFSYGYQRKYEGNMVESLTFGVFG
jgi:hypothetical protein